MAVDIDQLSLVEAVSNGSIGPIADLSYCQFPDLDQFSTLCDAIANSTKIFVLQVACCPLSIDHTSSLTRALTGNRYIQILDLTGSGLGDEAITELCPALSKMTVLIRLSLQHNQIGDAGAVMISTIITANLGLQSIQIGSNPFVGTTGDGMAAVVRAIQSRPDLSTDLIVPNTANPTTPSPMRLLDSSEKKWVTIPLRIRYDQCKPAQMAFFECARSGSLGQLGKLMKANGKEIDPTALHPEGFNAVHIAAANGNLKMLKELLKMGVSGTAKLPASLGGDSKWYTIDKGGGRMVRFALPRRSTPMFFASAADDGQCIKILIAAGDKAMEPAFCRKRSSLYELRCRNSNGLWAHDYISSKNEADMPVIDKDKAMKAESDRLVKLIKGSGTKSKGKQKKK